jgi:HEAT repeats
MKQDSSDIDYQPCHEFESQLILAAGDELNPAELADLNEHIYRCPQCAAALQCEKDLIVSLAENRREPDAAMLASCRASLEDALDREEEGGWLRRKFGAILPADWLAPRPAWSAALLVLIGFSVGILAPRYLRTPSAPLTSAAPQVPDLPLSTAPDSSSAPIDLRSAQVAGINVLPARGGDDPQVELQMRAQQPFRMQGTVNNENVKSVLINILLHNDRFDPDVRLDAVDLLRARNNDDDVRAALCHAVHTDRNAAVRLKALEALNGAEPQDIIRQTLLDALVDDQNPGVRVEAINALRDMAAKGQVTSDDHMLAVLRERMHKDPNNYIRLQSAAAIRDLGPREKF